MRFDLEKFKLQDVIRWYMYDHFEEFRLAMDDEYKESLRDKFVDLIDWEDLIDDYINTRKEEEDIEATQAMITREILPLLNNKRN
jgi:hypothetical protein